MARGSTRQELRRTYHATLRKDSVRCLPSRPGKVDEQESLVAHNLLAEPVHTPRTAGLFESTLGPEGHDSPLEEPAPTRPEMGGSPVCEEKRGISTPALVALSESAVERW